MNLDLIAIGLAEYGVKETPGSGDNPFILNMAKDCGFTDYVHDSIAWCSLAANWIALKGGYQRSKSLAARSWLNVGAPVELKEAQLGDVVILWRGDPNGVEGHVGFYIAHNEGAIYLFAGNQGDQFCIEGFDPARVLGVRRLAKYI